MIMNGNCSKRFSPYLQEILSRLYFAFLVILLPILFDNVISHKENGPSDTQQTISIIISVLSVFYFDFTLFLSDLLASIRM